MFETTQSRFVANQLFFLNRAFLAEFRRRRPGPISEASPTTNCCPWGRAQSNSAYRYGRRWRLGRQGGLGRPSTASTEEWTRKHQRSPEARALGSGLVRTPGPWSGRIATRSRRGASDASAQHLERPRLGENGGVRKPGGRHQPTRLRRDFKVHDLVKISRTPERFLLHIWGRFEVSLSQWP